MLVNPEREEEHEGERRQHDDIAQRRAVDRDAERCQRDAAHVGGDIGTAVRHREVVRHEGGDAGQDEADDHVIVDAQHIAAQPLIDRRASGLGGALAPAYGVAIPVGHETL